MESRLLDYEKIQTSLLNYGKYILTLILNTYRDSLSAEQKKQIQELANSNFIEVNQTTKEEIEFFNQLHGITEPENYRKDYIPSAHGGRTKGDNKIHFYPDSKAFLKCANTDDVIKECMDNLLVHEIFHYLIRPELKGINDSYKDEVQSFLTEGFVQKYTEDFSKKYGFEEPKSNYGANVAVAEKLLDTINFSKKEKDKLVFHSEKENILLKSKVGDEIYQQIVLEVIKNNMFEKGKMMQESKFEYQNYVVECVMPNNSNGFELPYLLVFPNDIAENSMLAVESNNQETMDTRELFDNAFYTGLNLTRQLSDKKCPVMVPIIPGDSKPYYQQLSKECFDEKAKYQRIDLQVRNMIFDAQNRIKMETGKEVQDKVFMNGYSTTGVFAQRFTSLHPEMVNTLCVGGASGSIPMPDPELDYPLGIRNYKEITGHDFDLDTYLQIPQYYYVAEGECINRFENIVQEDGELAPMHDMSYFDRSVPPEVGALQRQKYGYDLFERSNLQIEQLKQLGIHIDQQIIYGKNHNNIDERSFGDNQLLTNEIINSAYLNSSQMEKHR